MWLGLLRRLGVVEELFSCTDGSVYMRKYALSPRTPWGQLRLHQFFRGDQDKHCHDHVGDFFTFPLSRCGYMEMLPDNTEGGRFRHVKGWRWHKREAECAHRVLGRVEYVTKRHIGCVSGEFWTLIWKCPARRKWGFVVPLEEAIDLQLIAYGWKPDDLVRYVSNDLLWINWRSYLRGIHGPATKLVD
jgi:hypothetical protein